MLPALQPAVPPTPPPPTPAAGLPRVSFKIIDAVLFLNTRSVFSSLRLKVAAYRTYFRLVREMDMR
jgi:hypothetical protein